MKVKFGKWHYKLIDANIAELETSCASLDIRGKRISPSSARNSTESTVIPINGYFTEDGSRDRGKPSLILYVIYSYWPMLNTTNVKARLKNLICISFASNCEAIV